MQITGVDVTAEVQELAVAWVAAGCPDSWESYIQGACWALARIGGPPAESLEATVWSSRPAAAVATVAAPGPRATPIPGGIAPAPVLRSVPPVGAPNADQGLGFYAFDPVTGTGLPITKLADPLKEADMTQPPAPPTPGSMAERFEEALEAGEPALDPLDDETYLAVMAEIQAGAAAEPWVLPMPEADAAPVEGLVDHDEPPDPA